MGVTFHLCINPAQALPGSTPEFIIPLLPKPELSQSLTIPTQFIMTKSSLSCPNISDNMTFCSYQWSLLFFTAGLKWYYICFCWTLVLCFLLILIHFNKLLLAVTAFNVIFLTFPLLTVSALNLKSHWNCCVEVTPVYVTSSVAEQLVYLKSQ